MRTVETDRKASKYEVLTIIGLVMSPFTALRISFFGLSELALGLLVLLTLIQRHGTVSLPPKGVSRYYALFLPLCILGWIWNYISGTNSGNLESALFNFLSYLLTAVVLIFIEGEHLRDETVFRPRYILRRFFVFLSILSIFLYVVSLYRSTFLGFGLKYYRFFCPLADNIHQYTMIAGPLPFLGFYFTRSAHGFWRKLLCLILSLADAYIVTQVGATKADVGLIVGAVVLAAFLILNLHALSAKSRIILVVVFLAVGIFVLLDNITAVLYYLRSFFTENDNRGARASLYSQAFEFFKKSPIIGLGPSNHVKSVEGIEFFDVHETFLTAAISGGIMAAVLVFLALFHGARMVLRNRNVILFCAMIPIFIYSLGGDILRKLALWVAFLLFAYAKDTRPQSKKNRRENH